MRVRVVEDWGCGWMCGMM
jgi:hypothetical protein